jgi:hypothetical protein
VLRFLLWRIVGLIAFMIAIAIIAWLLGGGVGAALRAGAHGPTFAGGLDLASRSLLGAWRWAPFESVPVARAILYVFAPLPVLLGCVRMRARAQRRYVRQRVEAYRGDAASAEAVVAMFETLHRRLQRRWWRRLLAGQPSLALEVHRCAGSAWLAVSCLEGSQEVVQSALRTAYPNCRLVPEVRVPGAPPALIRIKKHEEFIKRAKVIDRFEHEREPAMNRLLTTLGACGCDAYVQLALTPTPVLFEQRAKRLFRRHEESLSRRRSDHLRVLDRSMVEQEELRGGLEVQHRPLFFTDIRIVARDRARCELISAELRSGEAENRLVERGTSVRQGLIGRYDRRVCRGEGNPLPSWRTGVFAATELAAIWHLPSSDYATVPLQRSVLPVAPAPPAIMRPADGPGTLRDALGPVCIHPRMRRQNTAVPGTVEQGKSSYLVATVAEDLRRERCAVIVLDPKGDAAEAAVSLVPEARTCTLLDLAHPTCGFDPLAADAPGDVIADYVVGALKQLFSDADIRASSDRYLRNAIIAVLAYDRSSTLWDAARLLSVGEEGYAYRARVGTRVRALPELKEISEFFTAELSAQLADSRSTTTAKLDAPVNKLARLLNSPSIKRVLLNDSLRVDFDRIIAGREVLVVKGALGALGAGNTAVLMQLLVGMLDAALARQQDLVPAEERVAIALKVDEAPLVLNRGFAETMALKRSAGLETVACWQTDSQWTERELRDQLDALFAHRVYFATGSVRDARSAVGLTMAEFSDTVRPEIKRLSALGRPDVRLHLPRHHAVVSWSTPEGRQPPFVAETVPLRISPERLAFHAARQAERGGRYLTDMRQPHWDRKAGPDRAGNDQGGHRVAASTVSAAAGSRAREASVDEPGGGRFGGSDLPSRAGPHARAGVRAGSMPSGGAPTATAPDLASEGYRELVALDRARSARSVRAADEPVVLDPDPLDLEILALVASMGRVLSSQIHRRFNPRRAMTTTQRRLKRLSDAGMLERLQFHRSDGGGVPMCCSITPAGVRLLQASDRLSASAGGDEGDRPSAPGAARRKVTGERLLSQVRHEAHTAGWALGLESALGGQPLPLRGARYSVLSPPLRSTSAGPRALGPADLTLPGGRVPHDFLGSGGDGERRPVERFETVRPDATIELPGSLVTGPFRGRVAALDLLVERDDRLALGAVCGKLERYDHLLSGWAVHTRRYGPRERTIAIVVFVCRDRTRARECARRAYAGEYPADWEYPGREGVLFVAERDVYGGSPCAYGVPRLPPHVRVSLAGGDPVMGHAIAERRDLPIAMPAR